MAQLAAQSRPEASRRARAPRADCAVDEKTGDKGHRSSATEWPRDSQRSLCE
jgi:hypothetical protein